MRIDVYGDVYDADYASEQIDARRGLPGVAVHPAVPRTSLWAAMARAAVVICPALWDEPFGMAAVDAQACGTPVVAFRRGGLAEIIEHNVTGFLVAPDDIQAAADSVRNAPRSRASPAAIMPRPISIWNGAWMRTSTSTGTSSVPASGPQSAGDPAHWLAGRVAMVTGASRGIGAATASRPGLGRRTRRARRPRWCCAGRRRGPHPVLVVARRRLCPRT